MSDESRVARVRNMLKQHAQSLKFSTRGDTSQLDRVVNEFELRVKENPSNSHLLFQEYSDRLNRVALQSRFS